MKIKLFETRPFRLFGCVAASMLTCGIPAAAQDYSFVQLSETIELEQAVGSPASPFGRFGHDIGAVGDTTGDGNDDVVFGLINVPDLEKGYIYSSKPFLLTYDTSTKKYGLDADFKNASPPRIYVRRARIADFTGDGRKDVFFGTTGGDGMWPLPECGEQNSFIVNTAKGWLDGSPKIPLEADYTHGIAGGDFNGDGAEDMLVLNSEFVSATECGKGHSYTNATYLLQFNVDPIADAGPKDIQSWLAELGYNPGPIDGQPGQKTATALTEFYSEKGKDFDGKIDQNEAKDLYAAFVTRTGEDQGPTVRKMALKAPQRYIDLNPKKGIEWENYSALAHDVDGDGLPELFVGSGDRTMILSATKPLSYELAAVFNHPEEFAKSTETEDCQRVPSGRCSTPVSDFIGLDVDGDGQDEVISAMTSSKWEGRYFQVFDLVDGAWKDTTAEVFPEQVPDVGKNGSWCWALWTIDLNQDGQRDLLCSNGSNFNADVAGPLWINEGNRLKPLQSTSVYSNLMAVLREAASQPGRRQDEMKKLGYQISVAGVAKIEGKETLLFMEKYWSPPDQAGFEAIRLYGLVQN